MAERGLSRAAERALLLAILLAATLAYAWAHTRHPEVTKNLAFPAWWDWSDQAKYLRAARAWASGDLRPAEHWYPPGYALLAAPFVRLMPAQPFYLVDLLCLLAYGALLVTLSGQLAPELRFARAYAGFVFLVTVALNSLEMRVFVEPWTTTPTAPLTLASLVLTLRLWDQPGTSRAATLGLAIGSMALFRPADAAPLLLAVGATTFMRFIGALRWYVLAQLALAGAAGLMVPLAVAGLLQLAVYGLQPGPYLADSRRIGFEWRLIPLRWLTVVLAPPRGVAEQTGLARIFPWTIPGVAGMAACLAACPGQARLRHLLVISAVALHVLLYLAYRDLHAPGLLRFGNYHCFKWCIPVLGLYAIYLVADVIRQKARAAGWAAGALAVATLFSWRLSWREAAAGGASAMAVASPDTLVMAQAPRSVDDGVFVPAAGTFAAIYGGKHSMQIGGWSFSATADFKAFPVPGGLLFTVLRVLPPGRAVVTFGDGVRLGGRPVEVHAAVSPRVPGGR